MSTRLLIAVIFLSSLALTGCSFKPDENAKTVFGFVRKNVGKSVNLRCEYPDEKGNQQIAYVRDNITRINGVETDKGIWNIMLADKMLWVWSTEGNKGFLYYLNEEADGNNSKKTINAQELVEKIEYQKQNCSPEVVPDNTFELPANIEFIEE